MNHASHQQLPQPVGYGSIADGMGVDNSLLIFRRFGSLNVRNLLYMQAELSHMESRLLALDYSLDGFSKGLAGWRVPRSWDKLVGSDEGKEVWELIIEIQRKLKQYNSALQAHAAIAKFNKPDQRRWALLTQFINDDQTALEENDKVVFRPDIYPDLVALAGGVSEPMTAFLMNFFGKLFQTEEDRRLTRGNLNFYSTGRVQRFVRTIAVIISSLLPVLSIVVLYFIQSQAARLATIVAFSVLCSLILSVLTDARNGEIIATTAAYVFIPGTRGLYLYASSYAAVQVVFVSGDISS